MTTENKAAEKCGVDRAGFEPATSALRMRRSYQAELPALVVSFSKEPTVSNLELSVCVS